MRWPNFEAAWFVVDLLGRKKKPKIARAYHCPTCDGWHVSRCRTLADVKERDAGLAQLRRILATKSAQRARKKKPEAEEGLT